MKTRIVPGAKPMKMVVVAAIAVIAALVSVGSGVWPLPNFWTTDSGTPESITIGNMPIGSSALIYIAEDQGYFAKNGLNVTLYDYNAGVVAVNGLLNNDVDISVATEYPIVGKAFKKDNISIIGSIDKYQTVYLIGRKDHGIENVSGLSGKRIGITRGTILEFYLGRYLDLHGISLQNVILVNIPQPSQYADAIVNSSVDAIVAQDLLIDQVEERLGGNIVILPAQNEQAAFWIMVCRNDWIAGHPETINKLLKSLTLAEAYLIDHPAKAKAIVQKRLNYTDAYMATMWPEHQFSLTLDQSLLIAMNDEGRWMIANNLTTEKTLPYFRNYIYTEGLEEVKPESVNIR